ncbi:uncharacterized protein [Physcomitrium patens]|uniref:uncharacterized protein isoform X2 n=1 Tax=Physcomitrium patens TaxID=3218 RepID=UPI003CCD4099
MASTSSEHETRVVITSEDEQINRSEVIYYTERLKEYYDRSDNDVMSTIATESKAKYLDQLKVQLQIGDDPPNGVVHFDPDPSAISKTLHQLGKEDLINLIMNLAKRWEEGGNPAEIEGLLNKASSALAAKSTTQRELTGIDRILKDGLLAFLDKIRQHLPNWPAQVRNWTMKLLAQSL